MNSDIEAIMNRAEHGVNYPGDSKILFNALKSAAQRHTNTKDMLKFLRYHIERGMGREPIFPKQEEKS